MQTPSTTIAELERALESINDALKEADESYAAAAREEREAEIRAQLAYDARAVIALKRYRAMKDLELLKKGGEAS